MNQRACCLSTSICDCGYVEDRDFNAALNLGSETDTLYSVVKIIRSQPIEGTDNYLYGCEFVGMAPILGYIFDEYEAKIENE